MSRSLLVVGATAPGLCPLCSCLFLDYRGSPSGVKTDLGEGFFCGEKQAAAVGMQLVGAVKLLVAVVRRLAGAVTRPVVAVTVADFGSCLYAMCLPLLEGLHLCLLISRGG